jgi:hypothetical protein
VSVEPSFEEMVFDGYIKGVLRLWPFKVILVFLGFALSIPTIMADKNLVVMRWM